MEYVFYLLKEFRALMTALEHVNCSCPLPARLEGRRDKMRLRRCGLHHVRTLITCVNNYLLVTHCFFQFKNVVKRKKLYCHDEIDEIKKGLKKNHSDESEGIYESIKDFPIQPKVGEDKGVLEKFDKGVLEKFESSCLNLGYHDDYRLLRNNQSKECILQEDEEDTDLNRSFHHLIHCFSCLFD